MTEQHSVIDDILAGKDEYLPPGEVARILKVDPKTVTRWASSNKIHSIRTPGGHRRIPLSEVRKLLENRE